MLQPHIKGIAFSPCHLSLHLYSHGSCYAIEWFPNPTAQRLYTTTAILNLWETAIKYSNSLADNATCQHRNSKQCQDQKESIKHLIRRDQPNAARCSNPKHQLDSNANDQKLRRCCMIWNIIWWKPHGLSKGPWLSAPKKHWNTKKEPMIYRRFKYVRYGHCIKRIHMDWLRALAWGV